MPRFRIWSLAEVPFGRQVSEALRRLLARSVGQTIFWGGRFWDLSSDLAHRSMALGRSDRGRVAKRRPCECVGLEVGPCVLVKLAQTCVLPALLTILAEGAVALPVFLLLLGVIAQRCFLVNAR